MKGTLPNNLPFCRVQSLFELGQVVQSLQLISDLGRLPSGCAARLVLQHSRTGLVLKDDPSRLNPPKISKALQVQHTQYTFLYIIVFYLTFSVFRRGLPNTLVEARFDRPDHCIAWRASERCKSTCTGLVLKLSNASA